MWHPASASSTAVDGGSKVLAPLPLSLLLLWPCSPPSLHHWHAWQHPFSSLLKLPWPPCWCQIIHMCNAHEIHPIVLLFIQPGGLYVFLSSVYRVWFIFTRLLLLCLQWPKLQLFCSHLVLCCTLLISIILLLCTNIQSTFDTSDIILSEIEDLFLQIMYFLWADAQWIRMNKSWSVKNKLQYFGLVMSRGLETPVGTWVRVLLVWVEVRIFGPLPNPYPQCRPWVTHTVLQWVESQNS